MYHVWVTLIFFNFVNRLFCLVVSFCPSDCNLAFRKYYSLNSNVIVTYGYDCENGVHECVKTMLIFAGFPAHDKFTAKSDLLQSIALSHSYKCTFYYKEACISCYNMRFVSELIFV